jgi:hypothetical protein
MRCLLANPSSPCFTLGVVRHSPWSRFLLTCLSVALMCTRTEAALLYDFEEEGTGTVLATLELASLPATHNQVLGLTFTPEGQAVFGYGPTYPGTFDFTVRLFVDDGVGGLTCPDGVGNAWINDDAPPAGLYEVLPNSAMFGLGTGFDPGGPDYMVLKMLSPWVGGSPYVIRPGWWVVVPEPTCLALVVGAVIVGTGVGRRRKRPV